ncbi:SAM dependent carboxyl methyltransferase [Cynara cardunculus var. scolymus]|uniref:SAM dependent carboxyl methyltransferase n=1 Tax=Cynara cardunculus var. scolymus TaxID=59895 RepID=A0A124SAP1_CYNCS|nr:SAM dependent carboxyl methyltransferase [Cynara cardunculus var. scolymus]
MVNFDINIFCQCVKIADKGCSSGTNTLLIARTIIDIVDELCNENNRKAPQFQVCLSDLYGRRRDSISALLLFKLFQVPSMVDFFQTKHCTLFTPLIVFIGFLRYLKASTTRRQKYIHGQNKYAKCIRKQFCTDFSKFLELRPKKIFLTFVGRSIADPTSDDGCRHLELLAQSLVDMLKELKDCIEEGKEQNWVKKGNKEHEKDNERASGKENVVEEKDYNKIIAMGCLSNSSFWNHFGVTNMSKTGDMDIKSLIEIEELQDKELDEAQGHRRKINSDSTNFVR